MLRDPAAVRRTIGLAGQFAAVDENLTGAENLVLVGRLNHLRDRRRRGRARSSCWTASGWPGPATGR